MEENESRTTEVTVPVQDEMTEKATIEEAPPSEASEERIDYAAVAANDLRLLREDFPELSALGDLSELEDPVRYGALRELGLTPREAYLATTAPRPLPRYDNRSHLRSAIPRTVTAGSDGMSEGELSLARELFDGLSDGELHRLYQKVNR